jgi:hypothetical protein
LFLAVIGVSLLRLQLLDRGTRRAAIAKLSIAPQ